MWQVEVRMTGVGGEVVVRVGRGGIDVHLAERGGFCWCPNYVGVIRIHVRWSYVLYLEGMLIDADSCRSSRCCCR